MDFTDKREGGRRGGRGRSGGGADGGNSLLKGTRAVRNIVCGDGADDSSNVRCDVELLPYNKTLLFKPK